MSGRIRPLVSSVSLLGVLLWARLAQACPVCAQRQTGPLAKVALGVLIVSPWLAALAAGWWIRRRLVEERSVLAESESKE